jgi:hypothetical protein
VNRPWRKVLAFHYTPKRLISEIAAWEQQRNVDGARINWMFTTEKARAKMGRAYPVTAKES